MSRPPRGVDPDIWERMAAKVRRRRAIDDLATNVIYAAGVIGFLWFYYGPISERVAAWVQHCC